MLEVTIPSQIATISIGEGEYLDQNGTRVSISCFTIIPKDAITTTKRGFMRQGNENLKGENSVTHRHYEGQITLCNPALFSYEKLAGFPVRVKFRNSIIGTHGVPFKGSRVLFAYTKKETRIPFEFLHVKGTSRNDGFHFQVFYHYWSDTQASLSVVDNRYNSDYSVKINTPSNRYWSKKASDKTNVTGRDILYQWLAEERYALLGPSDKAKGSRPLVFYESKISDASAHHAISRMCPEFKTPLYPEMGTLEGELAQRAVSSIDTLDINSLMFIQELRNIKSLLPPMDDIRKLPSLNPKAYANVYLWLRYGVCLSVKDSKKILSSIPTIVNSSKRTTTAKPTRVRASDVISVIGNNSNWDCKVSVRLLLETYPKELKVLGEAINGLYDLDLFPTLSNLWDMVPYSFVADWFLPVSRTLEHLDANIRVQSFTCLATTISHRWTCDVDVSNTSDVAGFGILTRVSYSRMISETIPTYGLFDSTEEMNTGGFRRFLDGASLLVQRL